jgi:hypothetical protein
MRFYLKLSEREAEPTPKAVDSKPIIRAGLLIWVLIFVLLAVLYPALADAGFQWWLHTSVVGIALGIIGLFIIRND